MQVVLIALSTAALIYLALCAALLVFQRSLLYFPQPSSLGSRDTTISLPAADAKVVASVRPRVGPDAVIYFGGNGEDVTRSVPGLMEAFPHHALYLLHYRGYGGSAGTPSEAAIVADALALFDEARREHRDVVVVGRSLGSGVAVRVASLRPAARVVLVTPYDSIQEIAAARYSFFPVRWLLRDKFESWKYAPAVDRADPADRCRTRRGHPAREHRAAADAVQAGGGVDEGRRQHRPQLDLRAHRLRRLAARSFAAALGAH